jgi:Flp pilus assembly protein TadG
LDWLKEHGVKSFREEHGAVAVEFALILPVLLLLLLGIAEFGRAYNAQISLTHAARESVRALAITNDASAAVTRARDAAPSLLPALSAGNVAVSFADSAAPHASRSSCGAGRDAIITISYPLQSLTGIAGPFNLTGRGVMRCAG